MICKNCIHNAVCKYGEARSNGLYCTGEKCKQYQSADVVPKSEVEELIRENESLAKTVNEASELIRKLRSKVKKSKSDVAREIFEEIANIMVLQHGFNEKHIVAHIDFELLKELKNKYTESENG